MLEIWVGILLAELDVYWHDDGFFPLARYNTGVDGLIEELD